MCYRRIFDTNSGTDSWNAIAANLQQQQNKDGGNKDNTNTKTNDAKNDDDDAKVHLMVAGIGTVCDESSIDNMRRAMPGLSVTRYARGTHSIHNSAREECLGKMIWYTLTFTESIILRNRCSEGSVQSQISFNT